MDLIAPLIEAFGPAGAVAMVGCLALWRELNRTRTAHTEAYSALERRTDEWREAQNEFRTTAIELLRTIGGELQDIRRRLEP